MKKSKVLLLSILIMMFLSGCIQKAETTKNVNLYPAFEIQNNKKLWGYIDSKGKFAIEPKLAEASDFSSQGLAKINLDNGYGVINSKGEEIVAPNFQFISDLNEDYFYAFDGKSNHIYNAKGERQFFTDEYLYIGSFSDGLFPAAKLDDNGMPIFGYLSRTGKVSIEPKYEEAWMFRKGLGLVKLEDNKYEIIGTDGKTIKELTYHLVTQIDNSDLYFYSNEESGKIGILDKDGNIIVEPKFSKIVDVADGNIVFVENSNDEELFGVSDLNGNIILESTYSNIKALGKGYFSVKNKDNDKYALADNKGQFITDYIYNDIGNDVKLTSDLIPVFDGEKTYLIDFTGKESNKMPEVIGKANITYNGKISKVISNGRISYYNSKGNLIWEENNFYTLKENAKVTEHTFIDEKGVNIKYPVVEGLKNTEVEDSINKQLYKQFVEDKISVIDSNDYSFYTTTYRVNRVNDLMIIDSISEYMAEDDIYPIKTGKIYNISLNKGTFFELKDLFKVGSSYLETLSDMVLGQMEQKNMQGAGFYDLSQWEGINPNENFIAQTKTIDIYLNPEEINSITEDFPKFSIEQDKISEFLDLNAEFWWTFMISKGF